MLHKMKLQPKPFASIKAGRKTIEMRLNDEKRQKVAIGDEIEFTEVVSGQTLICKVTNVYRYVDFAALYSNHDKAALGYKKTETADPNDMLVYYDKENIARYGVIGIEIKVTH